MCPVTPVISMVRSLRVEASATHAVVG